MKLYLSLAAIAGILVIPMFLNSSIETYAQMPLFNQTKAYEYIVNQYNATYGLVRETETIEIYWLWTDNLLAAHVLKDYDFAKSANITATIRQYTSAYDLDYRHPQAVLFDSPAYFGAVTNKVVIGNVQYSDADGATDLECSDFGDIAFLKAIHYFKSGQTNKAKACYDMGAAMFDGLGIRDSVFVPDGNRYSTYKLALYAIASNFTGYEMPDDVMKILPYMQDQITGGVYTHYKADLQPDSLTNVETTSLVIMAYEGIRHADSDQTQTEALDRQTLAFLVGSFAVVGFGVLLAKHVRR